MVETRQLDQPSVNFRDPIQDVQLAEVEGHAIRNTQRLAVPTRHRPSGRRQAWVWPRLCWDGRCDLPLEERLHMI